MACNFILYNYNSCLKGSVFLKSSTYHWNKNDLLKKYFKLLSEYLKVLVKHNPKQIKQVKTSLAFLEDMFLSLGLSSPSFKKKILKKQLKLNNRLVRYQLNIFERKKIEEIIKYFLNNKIKLSRQINKDNQTDYVCLSILFLEQIDGSFSHELKSSVDSKRLFVDNNYKFTDVSGSFFHVEKENYYYVANGYNSKTFLCINHEIAHGIVALLTDYKYDSDSAFLYQEVASILIEIYSNAYLYKNGFIELDEYVSNYNDIILTNIYESIEVIDVLYTSATKKLDDKKIKELINKMKANNPDYNITLSELTELSLSNHLKYLYSACIALAIYNNNKDNPKDGIYDALALMISVNYYNEEEIFKILNIDLEKGIKSYVDKNNTLIDSTKRIK